MSLYVVLAYIFVLHGAFATTTRTDPAACERFDPQNPHTCLSEIPGGGTRKKIYMNPSHLQDFKPLAWAIIKMIINESRFSDAHEVDDYRVRIVKENLLISDDWLRFCQVGIGDASWILFELLTDIFPNAYFHIFEADDIDDQVWEETRKTNNGTIFIESQIKNVGCDVIIFSSDSKRFTLHRLEPLYRTRGTIILVHNRYGCRKHYKASIKEHDVPNPPSESYCYLLRHIYEYSVCNNMKPGYEHLHMPCESIGCACFAPTEALHDPIYEPMKCEEFKEPLPKEGSYTIQRRDDGSRLPDKDRFFGMGQWHQDWFVYQNFFKHYKTPGTYVDIGAMDPFTLSNTATFDRCLNWTGVVIEPNLHSVERLRSYRSAHVVQNCVGLEGIHLFTFHDDASRARLITADEIQPGGKPNPSESIFEAPCRNLTTILRETGVKKIDYLSIDIEGWEISVLWHLPFDEFDIRVITVEVSHDSSYPLDIALVTNGFFKVALLGKDHVYVHRKHLLELDGLSAPWVHVPIVNHGGYNEPYIEYQRRFVDPSFSP